MSTERKNVISLGFFDGVHLGHQALMERTVLRAGQNDMEPAVFTFDRSPYEFVTGVPVPLITTAEARSELIRTIFPIEKVFVAAFDSRMMTMPWRDFIRMLADEYNAGWLVAGHNFRFGYKNEGTTGLLTEECALLGLGCDIIPPVALDGIDVSSTYIRSLLAKGDVAAANRFLGHDFFISGAVCHGKGLGGRIGAPTLNIVPPPGHILPAYGVYATRVWVEGERLPALTNVGIRPTVDRHGDVTVESHLLHRSLSLYGARCRVEFARMLRPEKQFGSLDALRRQIALDARQAEEYFQL